MGCAVLKCALNDERDDLADRVVGDLGRGAERADRHLDAVLRERRLRLGDVGPRTTVDEGFDRELDMLHQASVRHSVRASHTIGR